MKLFAGSFMCMPSKLRPVRWACTRVAELVCWLLRILGCWFGSFVGVCIVALSLWSSTRIELPPFCLGLLELFRGWPPPVIGRIGLSEIRVYLPLF